MEEVLDKEQIATLKTVFENFDTEKNGWVDTEMIGDILDMLGIESDDETIDELTTEFDPNGTGQLFFKDFCQMASRFMEEDIDEEEMKAELRQAFLLFDKEDQGFITTEVLREIFSELDDKLTDDDLDQMIREADVDGSGTIDFEEFLEVMTG